MRCREGYNEDNGKCTGKHNYNIFYTYKPYNYCVHLYHMMCVGERPTEEEQDNDGLGTGSIIGIVITCVVTALLILILIILLICVY